MKKTIFLMCCLFVLTSKVLFAQGDDQSVGVQREFTIKVEPGDAEIYSINNNGVAEKMGVGSRIIEVEKDVVYKLEFRKEGYQAVQKMYSRQKGGVDQDAVVLPLDEAYSQSEENSIANTNFNVSVNPSISATDAWKIISGIVESYFDEIQTMDAATTYLRTNWVPSLQFNKESDYRRIIRTQVIISSASVTPLKYNVKIKSELSKVDKDCTAGNKVPSVNRDECFEPFPRILRKYDDMINEIQRRMK